MVSFYRNYYSILFIVDLVDLSWIVQAVGISNRSMLIRSNGVLVVSVIARRLLRVLRTILVFLVCFVCIFQHL